MRARILYDNSRLEVSSVSQGSFFESAEPPLFVYNDNGSGQLDIYSVIMGSEKKVSGTGNIAIITFRLSGYGDASIRISDESQLLDTDGYDIELQSLGEGVISAK